MSAVRSNPGSYWPKDNVLDQASQYISPDNLIWLLKSFLTTTQSKTATSIFLFLQTFVKSKCNTGMKAVRINEFGGTEVLKIQEIERPVPREDEILIKVCRLIKYLVFLPARMKI